MTLNLSGPLSCLCSEIAACEYMADNEVDVLPDIFQVKLFKLPERITLSFHFQEETCQELCATNPECGYYTWYFCY